jgi:hypothetical protein
MSQTRAQQRPADVSQSVAPPQRAPAPEVDGSNAAAQEELGAEETSAENSATLDFSEAVTVDRIAGVMRYLANHPGEKGMLSLGLEAWASMGGGVLRGRLSGWANLDFRVGMNDQNFFVVAVDTSGALRAGLDVGKWLKVGGSVELGGNFVEQWFADTDQAAFWLYEQLVALDESLGDDIELPLERDAEREESDRDTVHDSGASYSVDRTEVGVAADAEVSALGANASGSMGASQWMLEYVDEQGRVIPSTEEHQTKSLAFEVPIKGNKVGAEYQNDWSNTVGSPAYYANGVFNEHSLDVMVPLSLVLRTAGRGLGKAAGAAGGAIGRMGNGKVGEVAGMAGDAVSAIGDVSHKVFDKLGELLGRVSWKGQLNESVFGKLAAELSKVEANLESDIGIRFSWNEFGEADGSLSLMYFRAGIHSHATNEVGMREGMPAGAKVWANTETDAVLYETLGTETVSYIQRQYIFQNEERPWEEFVAGNRTSVDTLVQRMADPEFAYYEKAVAEALERGGPDAGLAALENFWDKQNELVDATRHNAAQVAELVAEGNSMFTWFDSTREKCADDILDKLSHYKTDSRLMQFMMDLLPSVETDMEGLERLLKETGRYDQYDHLRRIAYARDVNPPSVH